MIVQCLSLISQLKRMAFLVALMCAGWVCIAPIAAAQLQSVWIAGDGENTRITVSSAKPLQAETFLSATKAQRAIAVIIPELAIAPAPEYGQPTGGVLAYEIQPGRLVFELEHPLMVARQIVLPPTESAPYHRYILDLAAVSAARFDKAARGDIERIEKAIARLAAPEIETIESDVPVVLPPTPMLKPKQDRDRSWLDVLSARQYTIVIDPGHGGRDPGALAKNGTQEADIVLKVSKQIQAELEKDGRYKVFLTRTDDSYVKHEDRVTKARNWGADLFISIHADAAPRPDVSGASVYTISTTGERRKDQTASKYGWHMPETIGAPEEVSGIIEDLIKRETKTNSKVFAEFLIPELANAGPLLRNPNRRKNLFVLLAPDVPAALIEVGFMTNANDAQRLKSKSGRAKTATAIRRGIDAYFDDREALLADN